MAVHLHPGEDSGRRVGLVARFEAQARFCTASSPLYHQLFAIFGRRLAADDAFAGWLLAASAHRASFDVPLLLLAALHQAVLGHSAATRELAAWYPSAGGKKEASEPGFSQVLTQSVDALRPELATFIASRPVQTNEAARGLCWLLPACYTGWPAAHLVELGASAGLNLIAEQRSYALADTAGPAAARYLFGRGREAAFAAQGEGVFAPPESTAGPQILSRTGCDLAPIQLSSAAERRYLAAFVWADQLGRMRTLNQAIDTLLHVNGADTPVSLLACRLPQELPDFLQALPRLAAPCILFNSYLNVYLPDKGESMQAHIARWALTQEQPVLWLQWEHLRANASSGKPPAFGWLGWTAQLWHHGQRQNWHLAWVHPHGGRIAWLPGILAWNNYWLQR